MDPPVGWLNSTVAMWEKTCLLTYIHLKLYRCKANTLHVTHAIFSVDTAEFRIQEQKETRQTHTKPAMPFCNSYFFISIDFHPFLCMVCMICTIVGADRGAEGHTGTKSLLLISKCRSCPRPYVHVSTRPCVSVSVSVYVSVLCGTISQSSHCLLFLSRCKGWDFIVGYLHLQFEVLG